MSRGHKKGVSVQTAQSPSSWSTHKEVRCNTSETKICLVHRDGKSHWHRVRKDLLHHYNKDLGRDG